MKYMLLMHSTAEGWADMPKTWSTEDIQTMVQYMHTLNKELADAGELVEARGLEGPDKMRTYQAQADGEPIITDGPFGETKEVLAGYWVIDVPSDERLFEIVDRISVCPGPGGRPVNQLVEIHPEGVAPA